MPAERLVEPDCPRCEGLGFVQRTGEDGRRYARRCDCVARGKAGWLLARTGVPERYAQCTLGDFETSDREPGPRDQKLAARRIAERYLERFELSLSEGRLPAAGLLFVGPPGVGKTHLAAAVLTELVRRYSVRGRFVDFTHLIHDIQASFDPRVTESRGEILDPVIDSDLVVIDELGAQKPTPFVQSMLYEVINSRYTARRPTIFTTNYLPDVLHGEAPGLEDAPAVRPAARGKGGFAPLPLGSDADAARQMSQGVAVAPRRLAVEVRDREMPLDGSRFELLSARVGPLILSRLYEMAQVVPLTGVADHRQKNQGSPVRGRR